MMKPLAEKVGEFYAKDMDADDLPAISIDLGLLWNVSVVRKKKRHSFRFKYERLRD